MRVLFLTVILGGFGYTMYYLYAKSQEKPMEFSTVQPFTTNIMKKTVATGSIAPQKEVAIKPRVSGIIEKIYVEEGQMIKKGDAIAKVKIVPDMLSLNNAENRIQVAKLALDDAQMSYDRQKKLVDQKVVGSAELQPLETALNSARQELLAAENNLQLIQEGALKDQGAASNTLIRSTATGMVLEVPVKEGNSVIESNTFNEGTTIASIADMGKMLFEGKLDESEVGKIREGMDLLITIGALEGYTFKAKLEHISPKGIEENGAVQFKIKAQVDLQEGVFVRSGYSANADIVLDKRDSVLAIKEAMLVFEDTNTFVEVETTPQVFEKKPVKVGLSDGINIEILEGIDADTKIKDPNSAHPVE